MPSVLVLGGTGFLGGMALPPLNAGPPTLSRINAADIFFHVAAPTVRALAAAHPDWPITASSRLGGGSAGAKAQLAKVAKLIEVADWADFETIKRLSALDDLDYSDIRADHAVAVSRLYLRLIAIRKQLRPEAIVTFQEWKRYETGLRAIGEVSFVGLRRNLRRIFAELELIERAGYFE